MLPAYVQAVTAFHIAVDGVIANHATVKQQAWQQAAG